MNSITAIFDIGKTNKKLLLFDKRGIPVYEVNESLPETRDEDGFPSENISLLTEWILSKWKEISSNRDLKIEALNFTSYGASFVYLDKDNKVCAPLYNYLKPYPADLLEKFYNSYGPRDLFSAQTASPALGMLNSGLQLYWLKHAKQAVFKNVQTALHLPQYLSFLFSGKKVSEFTSIGCHTALWDFTEKNYHEWVYKEQLINFLPSILNKSQIATTDINNKTITIGAGLHDSSAAFIPYKKEFKKSFLLISTGTWCVVLNPSNSSPLTQKELSMDCLNFFSPEGDAIRASRMFFGKEHDFQVSRIADYFNKDDNYYKHVRFDEKILKSLFQKAEVNDIEYKLKPACMQGSGPMECTNTGDWDVSVFQSFEEAYHQLLLDLTSILKISVLLADHANANELFVDGGFSKNDLFMNMIACHFNDKTVYSSEISQSTALGAAIHVNRNIRNLNWKLSEFNPSDLSKLFDSYYQSHYSSILVY